MTFNHYFQSELSALREQGRRFAEHHPALAPYLAGTSTDPDVERLLEGVAFLTGRLRQKLDDELPELTHSLMHLLWPNSNRCNDRSRHYPLHAAPGWSRALPTVFGAAFAQPVR